MQKILGDTLGETIETVKKSAKQIGETAIKQIKGGQKAKTGQKLEDLQVAEEKKRNRELEELRARLIRKEYLKPPVKPPELPPRVKAEQEEEQKLELLAKQEKKKLPPPVLAVRRKTMGTGERKLGIRG